MHCVCLYNKGGLPSPVKDVISSVEVEPNVQVNCNFLCYEEQKCVGFSFRHTTKAENCQLLNSIKGRTRLYFQIIYTSSTFQNEFKIIV